MASAQDCRHRMSNQLQEVISAAVSVAYEAGENHERSRIIELIDKLICPECEHAACYDLTKTLHEIKRGTNANKRLHIA